MNYSWKTLQFDTELFGFRTAKITKIDHPKNVTEIVADMTENNIQYATFRFPANNFQLLHALEKAGFILVDGLLSFERNLDDKPLDENDEAIRESTKDDLTQLKNLGKSVFYLNRFYNDPLIPKDKADELYSRWIENSVLGKVADGVLVWEENGRVLGFATFQKSGHLPLIGVSSNARGRGISRKLIRAALSKLSKLNIDKALIETQISNIAAIRSYHACGFKVIDSYFTTRWSQL